MKIVFISIGAYPYVSNWGYQDNELNKAAVRMGDSVTQISTSYIPDFLTSYIKEDKEFMEPVLVDKFGVKVIRLKYRYPWLGRQINSRLRWYRGLYSILEDEKPDIVFVHDLNEWSLFDITRYLKDNPKCVGFADLHATYENSCRNFLSKWIQHRLFYRYMIKRNILSFHKIFYLTKDALFFCEREYDVKLPEEKKEFLPIGGVMANAEDRTKIRCELLSKLGIEEDACIILHSGKLEKSKRTSDLIEAFGRVNYKKLYLIIIGKIPKHYEQELLEKIEKDKRILFLGWKTSTVLREYMIAADLYAQPGTESASLNHAICCGCPVMLSPQEQNCGGYKFYLDEDKVFYIHTIEDMVNVLNKVVNNPSILEEYRGYSYQIAERLLDYDRQIERIKSLWREIINL